MDHKLLKWVNHTSFGILNVKIEIKFEDRVEILQPHCLYFCLCLVSWTIMLTSVYRSKFGFKIPFKGKTWSDSMIKVKHVTYRNRNSMDVVESQVLSLKRGVFCIFLNFSRSLASVGGGCLLVINKPNSALSNVTPI